MRAAPHRCRSLCLVGFVLAGGMAVGLAQSALAFGSLTVPARSLPNGCRLKPLAPSRDPTGRSGGGAIDEVTGAAFPGNPWSGTDRRFTVPVRRAVDGTPRMPDAPPLDRREAAAWESKWADDIAEAYHAAYVTAYGGWVDVSAVRFNDATRATPEPPPGTIGAPRGVTTRLVRGATVILVSAGSRSECFQAIGNYIQSLK